MKKNNTTTDYYYVSERKREAGAIRVLLAALVVDGPVYSIW